MAWLRACDLIGGLDEEQLTKDEAGSAGCLLRGCVVAGSGGPLAPAVASAAHDPAAAAVGPTASPWPAGEEASPTIMTLGSCDTSTRCEALVSQLSSPFSAGGRAVITTAMPPAAAAVAGRTYDVSTPPARVDDPNNAAEDDTASAATLPMPKRARRSAVQDDDEEVTSLPAALLLEATAQPQAGGRETPSPGGGGTACAPADVREVLVAKVLTRSDAASRRVILPRIAVEANLGSQLGRAAAFPFTATDSQGASWPLVIKAWANGHNPKPVYVLEQVGDLLRDKQLGMGDAIALLGRADGSYGLEWNTPRARAAAARPTLSAAALRSSDQPTTARGRKSAAAAGAAAAAAARQQQQQQLRAQQQQQQPDDTHTVRDNVPDAAASPAAPSASTSAASPAAAASWAPPPQPSQPPPLLLPHQAEGLAPLLRAVPVSCTPHVSGAFIPTSPCQLLVAALHPPGAGAPDADGQHGSLLLETLLDLDGAAPPRPTCCPPADAEGSQGCWEDDALLVDVPAECDGSGRLHAGGFLLCPRTPGCTRPAGHQGWCLGHKGYRKRQRGAP